MISTGQGLSFIIEISYTLFGDWSTFALTYSLKKFLPDCSIYIIKIRDRDPQILYLTWISKLGVKGWKGSNSNDFISIKDTNLVMVRPIEDDIADKIKTASSIYEFCSEAKEDKFTPFLSFKNGCGNFVTTEWINKHDYPFPHAENFMTKEACVNEIEIIKLWKHVNQIYSFLSKGF